MKRGKTFGSLAARVLVIALIFASTLGIITGAFWLVRIDRTGVDISDAMQRVEFTKTSYVARRVVFQGLDELQSAMTQNQFKTNGSYDLTSTVDITKLSAGVSAANKDDSTSYTLEDLQKLYQDKETLNKLQSLLEDAQREYLVYENLIVWNLQESYGIDTYYVDSSGNLYGSSDMGDISNTEEAMEYIDEADSSAKFYKIDAEGNVALFDRNNDAAASLSWIDEMEVQGRLCVNINKEQINWDPNTSINYSDYGETFWYLFSYGIQYEKILPQSGELLAVYALKHPADVSIMDLYQNLADASIQVGTALESSEAEQSNETDTSLPVAYYWFHDLDTGEFYTNNPEWTDTEDGYSLIKSSLQYDSNIVAGGYALTDSGNMWEKWTSEALSGRVEAIMEDQLCLEEQEALSGRENYQLIVAINEALLDPAVGQEYFSTWSAYSWYARYTIPGLILMIGGAIAAVVFFIISIIQAGRRGEGKERYASAFARNIPVEILLAIDVVSWIFYGVAAAALTEVFVNMPDDWYSNGEMIPSLVVITICVAGFVALLLWQVLTLVCKGKSRNMRTNSLSKQFGKTIANACRTVYNNRKVTGKLVICFVLFIVISIIGAALIDWVVGGFILTFLWIITFVILIQKCLQRQRVKEGIHEIAGGNLDYQINDANLSGDDLDMAKDLNNVREGMQAAIQEQMKSERLKADLITNVSHDIKTPLTSIINYVDILKKENIQDEKIRGYIDILDMKSQRLKHLTEDLVEASKISSGNIKLDIQEINLKQLLKQTNGEFEEKFARKNLTLVCTLPENQLLIKADGRRMWRVIENLYNNAAKYAMPNSRVYVDGELKNGKVVVVIKNISEYPLNISADELMERFVRGDVSRNTEGSGLGLEIARNLTVMQNGSFDIYLDGDLFKVILSFDAI